MTLRFEHPAWLLLLALAVPMVVLGLRWFTSMSLQRRWSAVVLRSALIALIAAMLAAATGVRTTDRLAVVAVVDVSGSVRRFASGTGAASTDLLDRVHRFLREGSKERAPDDLLGVVVFDGRSLAVAAPTRADILDRSLDVSMIEGTDIAQALRLGAALIPADAAGRLVLFSDGNQTSGDALAAAAVIAGSEPGSGAGGAAASSTDVLRRGGFPIDAVPIAYNVRHEVLIESVDAPPQAPAESTATVRVVLRATDAASGTLQLLEEGRPLDINGDEAGTGRKLTLSAGRQVEQIAVQLDASRIHRYEAVFEPDPVTRVDGTSAYAGDTILSNNRGQAFTLTPGKGSVLVVDGVSPSDANGPGMLLPRTLREAGLEVTTVAPEGLPGDLLSMQAYDLIILQNVAAEEIPRPLHGLLSAYVHDLGGGLVMVGGPSSFGAGGWKGTLIEPILPVRLDLPERLVMPAAAVVIILDNSGSMNANVMGSARSQQEIANEGAALAVGSMDPTDLVGVISFNSSYRVQVPLKPNTDPAATGEIIRSIFSGGGTNLPPAMEEAHRQLRSVRAEIKHVIVLSDGQSHGQEILPELATRMLDDDIRVSSIAVGDGADLKTMREIAVRGDGQFYNVVDPNVLPKIFIKAVRVIRTPMIRLGPFEPVLLPTGSPLIEGLTAVPALRGLVLTQARDDPTVSYPILTPTGEPVLASWNVGLGRVVAFTSDAHAWARDWLRWPGYRRMWTQVARATARAQADRANELTTEIVGDELHMRLDASDDDGRPLDLLTVPATVYGPQSQPVSVRLSQSGPGVYEATVPAPSSGSYIVTVMPRLGPTPLTPVVGGAARSTGTEYRRLSSDIGLLKQIAEVSGGRTFTDLHTKGVNLFDRRGVVPRQARLPLWRTLLLLALVTMLLDVGTRRVAWDRLISREFGAAWKRDAAAAMKDRTGQAARALKQLRGRTDQRQAAPVAAPPVTQLSTDDAQRIVREQAERRRAARAAGRRADADRPAEEGLPLATPASQKPRVAGPAAASRGTQQPRPVEKGDGEPPAQDTASGLLAAKRRARERIEKEEDQRGG